jgi:oxygen-dependent protoporphyrinogen oxidase
MSDVIIIGAGISGLSCAWRLKSIGIDAVVLETSERAGGVIRTEKINGCQVEWGPNSFQPTAPILRLINEAGLWDDLLGPSPNAPRFVYLGGKLRKFPFGPLTAGGMMRILREPFVGSKSGQDESVRDFFVRRFGKQLHDRLVAPMLTGIYAADSGKLSMAAVFPKMLEMERSHGSLTKAFIRALTQRGKPAQSSLPPRPKGSIFSFPHGMETLPKRIAEGLNIQYGVNDVLVGDARATVITAPAFRAAPLFESRQPALAALLKNVQYSPMVIAATAVHEHAFDQPLQGFGFLAPRTEGIHLLGTLFSSALFPDRAPGGRSLLTSFIGGAFEPEAVDWPDDRVWEITCSELQKVLKTSESPEPVALFRHRNAIPQYNIGHERWAAAVKEELTKRPGLFIASNYLEGVSVPACIDQGERTAHAVAEYLGRKP